MSIESPYADHGTAPEVTNRSRWPLVAGVALVLSVLAATILAGMLHLRRHIFSQIADRDGQMLEQIAAVQFADDKANDESVTTLDDQGEQIQLALKISKRLASVLGVRLFAPDGKFIIAFPAYITEAGLAPGDLASLRTLHPVSHFVPRAQLNEEDLLAETNTPTVPLLVANIPLTEEGTNHLAGIAQFLVHGSSIAAEYAEMDRHLATQGLAVFSISGSIVAGGLWLAFRRLERTNRLLAHRTYNLLRANRELTLAAKTSAIGAVTSHLIHGLKNPLSGLKSFVQDRAQGQDSANDTDWQLAAASTQRMQNLIDRVVRVLQEQQTVTEYELSFAELLEMLNSKLQPLANSAGIQYVSHLEAGGTLSNRQADLVLLILENLLQNAFEATPAGRCVTLRITRQDQRVAMEIEDQGNGLSPRVVERLFTPCSSAKKGGSGIGLAISYQLATHLGATLELARTSPAGSCFRLMIPSARSNQVDRQEHAQTATRT